jgi:hypothetical protein
MDFRIDFGPWETVFKGEAYGHAIEIVSNPENFFLVLIYDEKDGERVGAVIEGYKSFFARGQLEAFVQTLPKECLSIEKNLGDKTGKLFFLSFEPFYVNFKHEDYTRKIDLAVKRIDENSIMIVDLARASSVELKELASVSKTDYASILGDPFTIKLLVSGKKDAPLEKMDLSRKPDMMEEIAPIIQLGLSKTREIIKEKTANLLRTQIVGQGDALNYAAYITAENMLLDNIPLIIFDKDAYFSQLSIAASNSRDLKESMVDFEPMAFPAKQLIAKQTMNISLADADLFYILELLGLKDNEFSKTLSLLSVSSQVNTPSELINRVLESKELSEYERLRAERMLKIIEKSISGVFGAKTSTDELAKQIPGKLGRATLIDIRTLNKEERLVFVNTIMRQLSRAGAETKNIKCTMVIPFATELLQANTDRTVTTITRLENRGIGIILGLEKELEEPLAETMLAKMVIVNGKDVAVSIKGKRNYRINLRPSLSGKPKA